MLSKKAKTVSWIFQLIAVIIIGQSLVFKFGAAEESVQLFTELDMEPEGRVLIGVLELIACLLILIPSSVVFGAILGCGLMSGAIIGHFTQLGWEGDRLELGLLAAAALLSCLAILYIRRLQIPFVSAALKEIDRD
ncbi:MAG: DoxX family protein [Verrucomicrobiota bacterium]